MNYTSIEQSKKLLELGLSPESADMYYFKFADGTIAVDESPYIGEPYVNGQELGYPCWSVGALLELMPWSMEEIKNHKIDLVYGKFAEGWYISYFDWTGLHHGHKVYGDSQIDVCYKMICWLLENKHIQIM